MYPHFLDTQENRNLFTCRKSKEKMNCAKLNKRCQNIVSWRLEAKVKSSQEIVYRANNSQVYMNPYVYQSYSMYTIYPLLKILERKRSQKENDL